MAKYLMFGKYSAQALKEMSIQRTDKALSLIKRLGGEVEAMYATLGAHDLVFIINIPDTDAALKISVGLTKLTGIAFGSEPAVTVAEFDKLMSEL